MSTELTTPFTALLGCEVPIQLAAMGGIGTPELAAAVAGGGGVGMIPSGALADDPPGRAERGVVGVNFLLPFLFDRDEIGRAASRYPLIEFFWGEPDAGLVRMAHDGGALAAWQVGSLEAARTAEAVGCDIVIAQGVEAGGHVEGTTPLDDLLDAVVADLAVPVVAAGGLATGSDVARVLDRGASAARIGTRFAAASESGAHPEYVAALIAAGDGSTELTTAFGEGWPDAPHRVLRSSIGAAGAVQDDEVATVPIDVNPYPLPVWSAAPPTVETTGRIEAMALYAGTGVAHVTEREPAAAILARLTAEAAHARRPHRSRG